MLRIEKVLADRDVSLVHMHEDADADRVRDRRELVEAGSNRAVAAAIVDPEGAVLLRRSDGSSHWRLPGSDVDAFTDLRARLDDRLRDQLGTVPDGIDPRRVYEHTIASEDRSASLYFVVFRRRGPRPDLSPPSDVRLRWFESPPDDLLNPGVVPDFFENE